MSVVKSQSSHVCFAQREHTTRLKSGGTWKQDMDNFLWNLQAILRLWNRQVQCHLHKGLIFKLTSKVMWKTCLLVCFLYHSSCSLPILSWSSNLLAQSLKSTSFYIKLLLTWYFLGLMFVGLINSTN